MDTLLILLVIFFIQIIEAISGFIVTQRNGNANEGQIIFLGVFLDEINVSLQEIRPGDFNLENEAVKLDKYYEFFKISWAQLILKVAFSNQNLLKLKICYLFMGSSIK